MIGTVLNIVLDPIMIQGMGLGATGAAVATVLGNIGASVYTRLAYTIRYYTGVLFHTAALTASRR